MARIILNAVAVAHGFHHLQIKAGALVYALRFHQPAVFQQRVFPPSQLFQNGPDSVVLGGVRHYIMAFGVDRQARVFLLHRAKQRIDLRERIDLVAEKLDAIGVVVVGREDFNYVAAHAESAALEVHIIAFVENFHQLAENIAALDLLAFFQEQQHAVIGFRRTQAVNAAH